MGSDYSLYRELVNQLMQGQESLPSLPSLTLQIRTALQAPDTTGAQLERLISRDPALSALLVKHASSAFYRQGRPAQNLRDVINVLGLRQVGSITMTHSLKSLSTLYNPAYKKLFLEVWERLLLTASTAAVLARHLGRVAPDHALLASLLSEVGSLVLLSAFKDNPQPPSPDDYFRLCQEYGKSLGVILLKRWAVDEEYLQIVRQAGDWQAGQGAGIECLDLVNLARQHVIRRHVPAAAPPLSELAAYRKLVAPFNHCDEQGTLRLITDHQQDIQALASSLRG